MTEYTITIDGYKSGLTESTVKSTFEKMYPEADVVIEES